MAEGEKRGRGRPRGKKSSEDYILIGGYIRKSTYRRIKHLLIDEDLELSELLEMLLSGWATIRENDDEPTPQ